MILASLRRQYGLITNDDEGCHNIITLIKIKLKINNMKLIWAIDQ